MTVGHQPVLVAEVLKGLGAVPGKHFVDATVGGGGHARALLAATAPNGLVLGIDDDAEAIDRLVKERTVNPLLQRLQLVHGNLKNLAEIVRQERFTPTGGCLIDLGFSSDQVDDESRGFSFRSDLLDLRYDPAGGGESAAAVVNRASAAELAAIFQKYGEEPLAKRIAAQIVRERQHTPMASGRQLSELVARVYRKTFREPSRKHPATRVFQALRIAVNDELGNLQAALDGAVEILPTGSRLAIISYHSLEDRTVKQFFRTAARDCICPPELPCRCDHRARLTLITTKPIRPLPSEIVSNPRARSAKLRLAQRC